MLIQLIQWSYLKFQNIYFPVEARRGSSAAFARPATQGTCPSGFLNKQTLQPASGLMVSQAKMSFMNVSYELYNVHTKILIYYTIRPKNQVDEFLGWKVK